MLNRFTFASFAAAAVAIFLAILMVAPASAQAKIERFLDKDYEYSFQYPADWPIQRFPEGEATKEVRVTLRGPNSSSFTVIAEKADKTPSKEEFEANPKRKEFVETMMQETIEQIYKSISANIKAKNMTVGERRDLSTESAIKFYIATRHTAPDGRSIIVAGIHAYPYSKDYAISFLMTAFLDQSAKSRTDALMFVFNSFHLNGEPSLLEPRSGAAVEAPEPTRPPP